MNAIHIYVGKSCCGPWSRLVHNFSLAENECEVKEAKGFSKPAYDGLKWMLLVCHRSAVISNKASMISFSRFLVLACSHLVFTWGIPTGTVLLCMVQYTCEEQVKKDRSKNTALLYTTEDIERCWSVTTREDETYHAIVKELNDLNEF